VALTLRRRRREARTQPRRVRYDRTVVGFGAFALSRSLVGFLFFCVLLLAGGAFLVWYVGPTATAIAFDGDRREAPYFLLQLIPRSPDAPAEAVPAQRAGIVVAAGADGGRQIWSANDIARHESRTRHGSFGGAMAAIDLIEFDRGGDLVQMLTGAEYRDLAADADVAVLLAGTSVPPQALRAGEVAVLLLYELTDPAAVSPLGEVGQSGWLGTLDRHAGRLAWTAPLDWVRGKQAWNRVAMLQFPDAAAASRWLRDPATLTERAIASRQLGDLLVLVALPPG
jgi:hypothetical protein